MLRGLDLLTRNLQIVFPKEMTLELSFHALLYLQSQCTLYITSTCSSLKSWLANGNG